MTLTRTDIDCLDAMKRYGGGFASKLAEAWIVADEANEKKLRATFGDLLDEYKKFTRHDRRLW